MVTAEEVVVEDASAFPKSSNEGLQVTATVDKTAVDVTTEEGVVEDANPIGGLKVTAMLDEAVVGKNMSHHWIEQLG